MDKDSLKKFYFSGASNFNSFQGTKAKDVTAGASPSRARHEDVSASNVNVSLPSAIMDHPDDASHIAQQQQQQQQTGGSAYNAVRNIATKKEKKTAAAGGAQQPAATAAPADAASQEYFTFLKRQQELQRQHNHLAQSVADLEESRRDRQAELVKGRRQALELLKEIETGSDWKLKSRYDVQQLIRDCGLSLQPMELVEDSPPQFTAITQLQHHFNRLKQEFGESMQYAPHGLSVDQALRRLSLLEQSLQEGNMDATSVARIADTLLVHLETVCKLPTVESMVENCEKFVDVASFKIEDARSKRDAAVQDGEVHVAERLCYDIIEEHENVLRQVIEKAQLLEKAIEENSVVEAVREQYHNKTFGEFEKIRVRCEKLKARCEDDIKKMYALREKVEEVEAQTAAKVLREREQSDAVLVENGRKLDQIFIKMQELEKEAELLERERHREVQKRLAEKDKDEHRRAEFARFCGVVDDHLVPLERTICNMDIMTHATDVVKELIDNSFAALHTDLQERQKLLKEVKVESHKQHVEVFRGLLLELAEIVYRKERMVEETDKKIQQAHVQQELLAETFNPNAKKFGDMKKSLLLNRDELEADVGELKERASHGMVAFKYSEDALNDANIEFVHPVTEQQHHTLAMKAKMLEFRAMLVGHTEGQPIMRDIDSLKQEVHGTKKLLDEANTETTGTTAKALPMIRAANKTRLAK